MFGQLVEPVPHLDVLDHPGDDLLEWRRDRAELERDLLVQGQVDTDPRLELREQRGSPNAWITCTSESRTVIVPSQSTTSRN